MTTHKSQPISTPAPLTTMVSAAGCEPAAAQPLWPSPASDIELPSGLTSFVEAGQGFPLVLVHGLLAYSFSWRKNIPDLAQHFRVFALDLAGCGHSGTLKQGTYGVEAWSRQLEEFLDTMGLRTVHLLGTSAGGAVALDFAARCPDRVEKLVLAAPVNPFSRRVVFLAGFYASIGLPSALLNPLVKQAPKILPWLFRHRFYSDPDRITPETVPGYLEGFRQETTALVLRQSICDWKPADMRSTLSRVRMPILLLWGDKDKVNPPSGIPDLVQALPKASVVMISHAGHLCYEEVPEVFNQHVLSFFR